MASSGLLKSSLLKPLSLTPALILRGGSGISHSATLSPLVPPMPPSASSSAPLFPASPITRFLFRYMSPTTLSVLSMSLAMSLHFCGYEYARSASLTLFTSRSSGFQSRSALPLALAAVFPASALLLLLYNVLLERLGPRLALRITTCTSSFLLSFFVLLLPPPSTSASSTPYSRLLVSVLFIFREAYVSLLATQHWSFLGSVLPAPLRATFFAPIGGLSSLSSAVAGASVGKASEAVGIKGLLLVAGGMLAASALFGEMAYNIAGAHGFEPKDGHAKSSDKSSEECKGKGKGDGQVPRPSIITKAKTLFARQPVLKALFIETLACQGLSTLMNVAFLAQLQKVFPQDGARASYLGNFYGLASFVSGLLQFVILPLSSSLLSNHAPVVWWLLPACMLPLTALQLSSMEPSLALVGASFLTMKVLEYSVRGVLNELVYAPLDFDSRYLGKEVIGMLGYRMGKSGTSLLLSAIGSMWTTGGEVDGSLGTGLLFKLCFAGAACWMLSAINLSRELTKKDASDNKKEE